ATLGALAGTCRSAGVPLVIVIIPRVGKADAPLARAESVVRLKAIAGHHALPIYDLSDSFDRYDPASRSSRPSARVLTLPGRKSGRSQKENATDGAFANPTPSPGSGNRAGLLRDVAHGWTPPEPTAWRGCRTAARSHGRA